MITIQTADGEAPAYELGDGPSVLFFIDGLGMRPAMQRMQERLAGAGYRVLMPDLFYRAGRYEPIDAKTFMTDEAARNAWFKLISGTTADQYQADVAAYLAHLPGPVGTTGYCMGGRMSIMSAERYPERIVAAAAYHPGGLVTDKPDSPHLAVSAIQASVYVGAAEGDLHFTKEQQATFQQALTAAGVDGVVEEYPAKHGWVPDDTAIHDATQAERHWDTLLALFKRKLTA